jgi:hypothetical protein
MNPTRQIESAIYNDNINVAGLIYDEISIHGRATLDEICRNIGALDPQLLTVVVNSMLVDKFQVAYIEAELIRLQCGLNDSPVSVVSNMTRT